MGDFDGDGIQDLAVANLGGSVSVLLWAALHALVQAAAAAPPAEKAMSTADNQVHQA